MSDTKKDIGRILDEKIPRSAVSERDGGGGRRLSYLEGHYVIDRLNKVFGHGNWSNTIQDVRLLDTPKPSYLVKVQLHINFPNSNGLTGSKISEGYGYGSDKGSNNPHELAIKEAVTDALKVAAKNLGMSMGLALYDKSQENVDDESPADVEVNRKPEPIRAKEEKSKPQAASPQPSGNESKETIEEAIRSYVSVARAQKKLTTEDFKKYLKDKHEADKLTQLTLENLKGTLAYLQALTK